MLRKTARRPGRPSGPLPTFVEACVQLDAVVELARTRRRFPPDGHAVVLTIRADRHAPRVVTIQIVDTRQPLGGVRRWWQCPQCRRRCRFLLLPDASSPIGCRSCLAARYLADYPGRARLHGLGAVLRDLIGDDSLDTAAERELALLGARKRRGVRRGRRLVQRLERFGRALPARLARAQGYFDQYADALQHAEPTRSDGA